MDYTLRMFVCICIAIAVGVQNGAAITSCPELEGVQVYPDAVACDKFFLCINGTLTFETCPNGLLFDGLGEVTHYCRYEWQVDCGDRKERALPISTEFCPWLYGIFPITPTCNTQFYKCAEGEAFITDCEPGLAYDDRIHACNWPDLLDCNSEQVVGFSCPKKPKGLPARFYPHPRYPHTDCTRYITCVNNVHPRLISCGHGMGFNPDTLGCEELKHLPGCQPLL
uniref:Peritrophin-1 n=1 Tax=Scolopendra viridis TaxID=118503 RepID=A0A4D5RAD2_SCOVI